MQQISSLPNFEILEKGKYSSFFDDNAILTFHQLVDFVAKIPFGKNSSTGDFSLIFTEKKGTCSTKHGILMEICELNHVLEVELMLGIFLLNPNYSGEITSILDSNQIEAIPEAHCYLRYKNVRYDFTTDKSSATIFEPFLIREQRCDSHQVFVWKPMIYKNFLESWLKRKKLKFSLSEILEIREKCIFSSNK